MLKRIYDYYFYKISKFYKEKLKAHNPCYFANALFFSAINCIILSLISVFLITFDVKWKSNWIYWISAIIILSGIFWGTDEGRYQNIIDNHKDEKHSNLKGWLVFLSIIGSFALWMTTCFIMNR